MKGLVISAALLATITWVAACADSPTSSTTATSRVSAVQTTGTGTDSVTTGSGGTPARTPAAGPVASIRVTVASQNLPLNYVGQATAEGLNAAGDWTGNVQASWSSSNSAVATVADTGVIFPKSQGTTTITATFGGFTASATITVIAATASGFPTQQTVSQFNLSGVISGILPGTDTSHTEPIANATVTLYRLSVSADSLTTPAAPVLIGTTTTDANGGYAFPNLASGAFQLTATPPSGSPYAAGSINFGTPNTTEAHVPLSLKRK